MDITPPEITISAPAVASYLTGDLEFTGRVADDLGINSVQIHWAGGSQAATVNGTTWTATIAAGLVADGEATFTARAVDGAGKPAQTQLTVYLDTKAPTVLVTAPVSPVGGEAVYNSRIQFRGRTYDKSPVDEVEVVLYRPSGTDLVPVAWKSAVDTASWAISFERGENPGQIPEAEWDVLDGLGDLPYEVRATDRAGNTSSRFYHVGDLPSGYLTVEVLGLKDQSADPSEIMSMSFTLIDKPAAFSIDFNTDVPLFIISVPSDDSVLGSGASAIGIVSDDKAIRPASIRAEVVSVADPSEVYELGSRILGNAAPGAQSYSFEIPLVYPPGTPKAGDSFDDGEYTIVFFASDYDPENASIPDKEHASDSLGFTIDGEAPSIQNVLPEIGGYIGVGAEVKIEATVLDKNGIRSVKVNVNNQGFVDASVEDPANPDRWSALVTVIDPGPGQVQLDMVIEAEDNTGKIGRIRANYGIDTQPPEIEFQSPDLDLPVNGFIRLKSFIKDNNKVQSARIKVGKDGEWENYETREYRLDTSSYENILKGDQVAGRWVVPFEIEAYDSAGFRTQQVLSFTIDQSSDSPVIQLFNLDPAATGSADAIVYNFFNAGPELKGSVEDDDGIAIGGLSYVLDGAAPVAIGMTRAGRYLSFSVGLTAIADGIHSIRIAAVDDASLKDSAPAATTTVGPVYFMVDRANPVLTETQLGTSNVLDRKTGFSLSGSASDAFGIASLVVTQKLDDGDAVAIDVSGPVLGGSPQNRTWNLAGLPRNVLALGSSVLTNGVYEYVITTTDLAGKTQSLVRTVRLDTIGPETTIVTPGEGSWANSSSVTVSGVANDLTGIRALYQWQGGSEAPLPSDLTSDTAWAGEGWIKITGTSSWSFTLSALAEGSHRIWIRSVDLAGNVSAPKSLNFGVDLNNPELSDVTTPAANTNAGFSLGGKASDTNSLAATAVTVTQKKGTGSAVPITISGPTTGNSWADWTLVNLPRNPASIGAQAVLDGSSDGIYEYVITVADVAGKTSQLTRTVRFDATAGSAAILAPALADQVIGGATFTFSGSATDGGSGVAKVRYSFDNASWTDAAGTENWNANVTLASLGTEGPKTLYVQVLDTAGNTSTATFSRAFVYDTAAPVVGVSGGTNLSLKAVFGLSGTASDNYGIDTLAVTQRYNGGAAVSISGTGLSLGGSAQSRTWTLADLPRDPGTPANQLLADGTYLYEVHATDLAGRSSLVSTVTVVIDTSAPNVNDITAPGSGQTGVNAIGGSSYQFRGSASDAGVGLAKVWYAITTNTTAPTIAAGESPGAHGYTEIATTANWNFTKVIPDDLAEGLGYYLHVLAEDSAGNRTPTASASSVLFDIDRNNPVAAETTVGTTNVVNRKVGFSLAGTATDSHGIASVTVTQKMDDGSALAISTTGPSLGGTDQNRSWTLAGLPRDPISAGLGTTALVDGVYEYQVIVTDKAGKTHSVNRTVRFDATGPTTVISTPAANSWANATSVTVRGNSSDLTGIKAIYYQRATVEGSLPADMSSDANWAGAGWSKATGTSSWDLNLAGLSEGMQTLWIRSLDTVLNVSTPQSLTFGVDLNNPALSDVTTPPASTNAGFSLGGKASDTNSLATTAVSVTQKKGTGVAVAITTNGPTTLNSWADWTLVNLPRNPASIGDQAVLNGTSDGIYEYVITVADVAGKTSQVTRTVRFDATAGTATILAPATDDQVIGGATFTFSGSAADGGSGVAKVRYSFDNASWTDAAGTESWNANVTLAGLGAEGPKTLYVQVLDNAGNTSTASFSRAFVYDTAAPLVGVDGGTNLSLKAVFGLSGTASDNYGIANLAVTQSYNGGTAVSISGTGLSLGGSVQSRTWSLADLPRDPATPATQLLADGSYVYEVLATDLAGRSSLVSTVTVVIDTSAPNLNTISTPGSGQTGYSALSGAAYTFRGTAGDAGVGVARIWYAITKNAAAPVIATTPLAAGYTALATTASWSFTKTIPGEIAEDTGYYLHVLAEDGAGNRTATASAASVLFDVDQANPVVLETAVNTSSIVNRASAFSLTGSTSDSHGIAALSITQSKDGGAAQSITSSGPSTANAWATWNLSNLPRNPLSAGLGTLALDDGLYEYTISVTDFAGRVSTINRSVRFDATGPVLIIGSLVPGEPFAVSPVDFSGAVNDGAGSGVASVQYSLNGVDWSAANRIGASWNANLVALGSQGTKQLHVKAADILGNETVLAPVTFYFDSEAPVLSETVVNTVNEVITNSSVTLAGTATDSNAMASVVITATKNGVSQGVMHTDADLSDGYTYTLSVIDASKDGNWIFTITATDAANRTTSLERRLLVDRTAPSIPVIAALPAYVGNSLSPTGTAADGGSGLNLLQYSFDNSNWFNLQGTAEWFGSINIGATGVDPRNLPEGSNTLYVRSRDRAGNFSASANLGFTVDRNDPVIASPAAATSYTKFNTAFTGTASDTLSLAGLSAMVSKDGAAATAVDPADLEYWGVDGPDDILGNADDNSWSIPIAISSGDGTYVFTVTATDSVGRTATLARTFVVDTSAPSVSVSSHSDGNVVSSASLVVSGTAADALSGVAAVEYRLNTGLWTGLSGTTNWNGTINLGAEGSKTLDFRSVDALGTYSALATITINLDLTPPVLTETGVGTITPRRSSNFILSGQASDTNGLKTWDHDLDGGTPEVPYVLLSINGAAAFKLTVAGTAWSHEFTVYPDGSTDYDHTFTITATDIVDKSTSLTRTVSVDATLPVITVEGVTAGLSGTSVNGVISFRFSAADAGVGVERAGANYQAWWTIGSDGFTPAGDVSTWTSLVSSSTNFTLSYDTLKGPDGLDGTADDYTVPEIMDLYVAVRDGVSLEPNIATAMIPLSVDQESDRPIITLDNLDAAAPLNSQNGFGQNPTFLLTIEDDDRVKVAELQYRIDINNDGNFNDTYDFWNGTLLGADGDTSDKWEDESVWLSVEEVPATDRALAQAKIKLTGFPQGAFRVQIRARDNTDLSAWSTIHGDTANFSWSESAVVRFSVDYGPPSIAVSSPVGGVYNSDITLSGTATDALGVISVDYTLDGGSSYINVFDNPLGVLSAVFGGTIDVSGLVSGEYVLQVEATDFGGTTATQQIPITIDRTPPTVNVLQPASAAVLNGASVTVQGDAADNRQMGAIFLWHGLVADADPAVLPQRTGVNTYAPGSYVQVGTGYNWSTTIDTSATASTAPNGYRIRVVAVDSIGNVGIPVDHLVTINQASDRPVIAFSNLSIPGPSRLALGNLSIIGTVTDDDSVDKDSLQIRIDRTGDLDFVDAGEGWVAVSGLPTSNSVVVSWVHEITDLFSEGLHHVQVRALDIHDLAGDYSTGYNWNVSAIIPFFIDNGPPALTLASPTLGQRFNVDEITITGSTQDTNGIKRVVIWVDDDEDSIQDAGELTILGKAMDNSGTALTTDNTVYPINQLVSGLSDGVKTVRVTSYDSSDAITVRELTVVIDTTPPSASISTPSASSTINGTVPVIGTATDNYQVSQVFYNVRLSADGAPAYPAAYTQLTGQTYAWNFNLNSTLYPDGDYTLRIVVVDSAGNDNSMSPATVAFTIDQNTDKPIIDVLTLSEGGTAVQNLLPASLAVSGTVQDDDAVDRLKIEIRVDRNNDGAYDDTDEDWVAVSNPPASNTALAIWSHTFTGLGDGQYTFQVRAADTNDAGGWGVGAHSWSSIPSVAFAIDLNLPTGAIVTPAVASYHRSNVAVSGTSSDASGIKKITIAYDTGSGYTKQDGNPGEDTLYEDLVPGDGYVLAPAWTDTYLVSNGDGQVYFRVTITDAFDKVRTYESNFTVDTLAPSVGFQLPASGSTLNGSILARGSTSDTYPVTQVWFKVNNAAGPGTWAVGSDLSANGWTLLSGTTTWERRFKSTDLADGASRIYIVAVDAAGNRSNPTLPANQLDFAVAQANNLPVISLSTADNALLDNGGVITGTITDDDGVNVSTLQISFDGGSTWRAVSNPGTNGAYVTFSHAVAAGAGLAQREAPYSVVVRVNDIGENFDGGDFTGPQDISPVTGISSTINIKKDDSVPVGAITSLNNGVATVLTLSGAYVSGQFTLTGTAADGVRVASVEARLPGLAGNDSFAAVTNTGTDFSTWSWAKSALTLAGETQALEIRVSDVNGRTTVQSYTLLVDIEKPTIGFDSTTLNPDTGTGAYNGTVSFRGNASDNVLVSEVYYRFAAADPGAPDAAFTGWTKATSTYSWTAPLDTTTIHNLASDFAYRLYAVSIDAAGNIADRQNLAFTINQGSDQPVLSLSSPLAVQVLQTNAKAQGSLSDDDGLASVEIRIDRDNDGDFNDLNEDYVPAGAVSGRNGNLDFDLSSLADGFYKLQVRVRDTRYATTLSAFNQYETAVISFSIDTLAPALDLVEILIQTRYVGDSDTTIASGFNGSRVNNDFTMTFTSTDSSGISSVQTSLDNAAWTAAADLGGGSYEASLPISSFANGTRLVYYRATDNNGKITSSLVTLLIDKTEPVVSFSSPSGISTNPLVNAPNVNGTAVTITGAIADSSTIDSLVITGGLADDISFVNTGNNTSWSFTFDSTQYDEAAYATDVGANVWRLPITLTAYDAAGNRVITTGYVDLDPDGDKPIVSISTPTANASVTGIISLNGTVVDDDGTTGAVSIALDTNNDTIYDQIIHNVPVSNGAWSYQVNTLGDLSGVINFQVTPYDGNREGSLVADQLLAGTYYTIRTLGTSDFSNFGASANTVGITFRATGVATGTGTVSPSRVGDPAERTIFIDSSLPQIVDVLPATTGRKRGLITISARFQDDDSIPNANLQVSLDGGTSYIAIGNIPGATISAEGTNGSFKYKDVSFSFDTARYFPNNWGNGTMSVILQATDNTYKPSVISLSYAVDNRSPEGFWNATGLPTLAGRYLFSGAGATATNRVQGTIADGGASSDISHVDVYFIKDGDKLYDPKQDKVSTSPGGTATEVYTQLAFSAANVTAGTDTVTLNRGGFGTPVNDRPVRFIGNDLAAGLDANILYYIRDLPGDEFKLHTAPASADLTILSSEVATAFNRFDKVALFMPNGTAVRFIAGTPPSPLALDTTYFVVGKTGTSFQLSASAGGSAITLANQGTGPMTLATGIVDLTAAPGSGNMYMQYAVTGVYFTDQVYTDSTASGKYAIRVDKQTELGAYDTVVGIGDQDGFQESLKIASGLYDWFAYFNTFNLPDGPMDVYYAAYDLAGNKVVGKVDAQIANYPPSIVSATALESTVTAKVISAVDPVSDRFTSAGHGLANGDAVYFTADVLPAGLNPAAGESNSTGVYYVRDISGDTFKVATAVGQLPVDITSTGVRTRFSRSSLPWKFRKAAVANASFQFTAQDIGAGTISTSGWDLDLISRHGNETSPGALQVIPVVDYDPSAAPAGSNASFIIDLTDTSIYLTGYWYRFRITATDNDGNVVTEDFYLRVMAGDNVGPRIRMRTLDQRAVGMWTTHATPLSLGLTQGNISGNRINLALPSWITAGTRVRFAGATVPTGAVLDTTYFIRNITAGTNFELWTAATGGTQLPLTNATVGSFLLVSGGHVEDHGSANGYDGDDADISGAVLLTGTVYDDFDVQSLQLLLNGSTVATMTQANGLLTNKRGNEIDGFTYDWSYLWDTSSITEMAKANVVIGFLSSDGVPANNQSAAFYPMDESDETEAGNTPVAGGSITVDVVPYITRILDPTGLSEDVLRGSKGRYSISSHATNLLTVRGYNLGKTGYLPAVRNSSTEAGWATGTLGAAPTLNSVNEILVTKNWARSGWLTVAVNSTPSGNNLNTNPPSANTNPKHHNDESTADPRTRQWNDDRYLWVWGVNPINITQAVSPTGDPGTPNFVLGAMVYENPDMVMLGDQPSFTWNDTNGGNTLYNLTDSTATRRFGLRLTRPAATAIADVDPTAGIDNRRFIVSGMDAVLSAAGDLQAGFLEVTGFADMLNPSPATPQNDPQSPSTEAVAQRWMTIQGIDYYGPFSNDSKNNRVFNRFPHPKIITETGNAALGNGADIYLAYYDASPSVGFRNLNFVSFRQTGQRAGNLSYPLADYGISANVVKIPGTENGNSSQYFDMVKVGATGIAIAYYDPVSMSLKLTTTTNAFAATGNAATDNLSLAANTHEAARFTVGNSTRANWVGKYFTITNTAGAINIWFDTTGTANKPAGALAPHDIRVDISAIGATDTFANRNALGNAVATALRTAYTTLNPSLGSGFLAPNNNATVNMTSLLPGNLTDINVGNLVGAGTDGTVAVVTQGVTATAPTWSTIDIDTDGDVGQYVSMVHDTVSGYLFLAYYDFDNANLKLARVPWNSGSPQSLDVKTINIDNYLSAGSWTNIGLLTNVSLTGQSTAQPIIAYYADSYNGTRKPIRFAFPLFDATTANLNSHGALSEDDDQYSGNWEVMTIMAITTPKGGASTFNKVQLGKYGSGALPVVGWVGSGLEYGKLLAND